MILGGFGVLFFWGGLGVFWGGFEGLGWLNFGVVLEDFGVVGDGAFWGDFGRFGDGFGGVVFFGVTLGWSGGAALRRDPRRPPPK